jgi:hypothetical protein
MDEDNIQVSGNFIIEILGKPKDHVQESLEKLIESMDQDKGVFVSSKKIHEPKKIESKEENEKQDELFTSFAELEVDFEKVENLLSFVFKYMPSNIEITKPENFVLKNDFLAEILTSVILRLHKYDEIAKKLVQDNRILQNKLNIIGQKIKEAREKEEKNKEKMNDKSEEKENKN